MKPFEFKKNSSFVVHFGLFGRAIQKVRQNFYKLTS